MISDVLVCVVVTDEEDAERALESAARIGDDAGRVDVLVLDETTRESEQETVRRTVAHLGLPSYRSPRRLGGTRAINLALRAALDGDYSGALLMTGADVLAASAVERLAGAAAATGAAAVMAWSTSSGEYALECTDAVALRKDQEYVDAVGTALASNFGDVVFDVPHVSDACVLLPLEAVREVGLLDPVLEDRGAALTEWSLRARARGRRICLAPAAFVASSPPPADVPEYPVPAEVRRARLGAAVVDLRYPQFREQMVAFRSSGLVAAARAGAGRCLVREGARTSGYAIEVGWLAPPPPPGAPRRVRCSVSPEPADRLTCEYRGFTFARGLAGDEDVVDVLAELFEGPPAEVHLYDRGTVATAVAERTGLATDHFTYPTRV